MATMPFNPIDTYSTPASSGAMMPRSALPVCISPLARPKCSLGTSMVTDGW